MGSEVNEGSTNLAKVLWYYNLLQSTEELDQKIVCPFHNDVNPSMKINLVDGNFFCFGCEAHGDAMKFVNMIEKQENGLNDLQALKKYVRILRSKRTSSIKIAASHRPHNRATKEKYDEAWDYYYGLRKVDWRRSDALDDDAINARSYMAKRGFSPDALWKCGAKVNYSSSYGLIFPMMDNGKFKGWVCRTMKKDVEARRKYLYNEGFSRANTLVGEYGSKDWVIVVEGYMDRLKFVQFGEENVVAILGWKMSADQERKLKDAGVKHIISALDNDSCGEKGTSYLRTIFQKVTRFCYLKNVKDPGEMTKELFDKMWDKTKQKLRKEQNNGNSRQDKKRREKSR